MESPPPESALTQRLNSILAEKMRFRTFKELQITSKHLHLEDLVGQSQVRIDLAGIHPLDASIHFFEVESQFHIQHPQLYRFFCDYCYLVCPESQFDYLDTLTKDQQLRWAKEAGIGVITLTSTGLLQVRRLARFQETRPEVRQEVLRLMSHRSNFSFETIPLWERSHQR
ncbi:MAG: hypothetical protein ACFFFG_08200 [Candidatus Thorarchaeota archaeon]